MSTPYPRTYYPVLSPITATDLVDDATISMLPISYYSTGTTASTIDYWGAIPWPWQGNSLSPGMANPIPYNPPRMKPSGFNKYVNASDLLEEFIAFLGSERVKKGEVMGLPVELFIKWLIIRACEEDEEEPNVVLQLPAPKAKPRCLGCGQYMHLNPGIPLIHNQQCSQYYFSRKEKVYA